LQITAERKRHSGRKTMGLFPEKSWALRETISGVGGILSETVRERAGY